MHKDKILIVDDDESMREMLEAILKGDYEVIKAASGEEALIKLSNSHIPLVLLDIKLPGMSGIETLEKILKKDPDIKCLMLSAVHDVDTVVECMRRGAYDYMTKELEHESVLLRVRNAMALAKLKKAYDQQIHKVMRLEEKLCKFDQQKVEQYTTQEKDFNPKLPDSLDIPDDSALKTIFQRLGSETTNRLVSLCMKGENLTGQEQKVLELILKGLANKEIAKELHIEVTTVKAHLRNSFQKLGVTTRSQAIACLLLKGLFKNTPPTT
ncbi:MAG: response regulator transcription factor [Nitrospirota bacterium]